MIEFDFDTEIEIKIGCHYLTRQYIKSYYVYIKLITLIMIFMKYGEI